MTVTEFRVPDLCCPTEERMIRDRLEGVPGIDSLEFNLMSRTLRVGHTVEQGEIVSRVAAAGMTAVPIAGGRRTPEPRVPVWRRRSVQMVALAGVLAAAAEVLVLVVGENALPTRIVALAAVALGGVTMFNKGWRSIVSLSLNINALMTIAVIGALVIGEWAEAAMVVVLFAIAELIEEHSLDRARDAVARLMALAPSVATVMRGLGFAVVPVDEVAIGEIVRIRPGERIPLDGVVRHGAAAVDQAPITGESIPVEKVPGDQLFAGSISVSGAVDFEVTRTAGDSTISQIAALVEKAGANKAQSERFIDRFARVYTPAMLAVAALVAVVPPLAFGGGFEDWLYRGLVLLVIGCPCALVISTPVTVVSGLAAAARRGILIKGGAVLEAGAELKAIAFDKTGTLTVGRPAVTDVIPVDGLSGDDVLHLAAAVEARSEHPIALAIGSAHRVLHGHEEDASVSEFAAHVGLGASGVVDGRRITVGNHRLAHERGACTNAVEAQLEALESAGRTSVVVIADDRVVGIIGVADTLRSSAARTVAELHDLGLRTALLTGDTPSTALAIAQSVGIDDVRAGLLPGDKIAAVQELQAVRGAIGMVGDGINDVPALAQSHVGFAMGVAGTDITLETADVALMDDNLLRVPEFIRLSRRTRRLLAQNIAIALGLKFVFFALALAGEATLWMAVFADMGASLIVVGNGLRLLGGRESEGTHGTEGT